MLMPALPVSKASGGWSLIELLISMATIAIILAAAGPNVSAWVNNTHIRSAAESINNGLQMARAEAVRRNTSVSFYLTDSVDNSCALVAGTSNWVVALTSPVGACADATNVLQRHPAADGGGRAVISSPATTITFNGLGRATTGANSICVGLTDVSAGCIAAEPEHQLAVQVTAGGQIKMCSMSRPAGDPQRC